MPKTLKLSEVKKYNGDKLISTDYKNNKSLLQIICNLCNGIYNQNFDRYSRGFYHNGCNKTHVTKFVTLKPKICVTRTTHKYFSTLDQAE